jgi:hypothetical protein
VTDFGRDPNARDEGGSDLTNNSDGDGSFLDSPMPRSPRRCRRARRSSRSRSPTAAC